METSTTDSYRPCQTNEDELFDPFTSEKVTLHTMLSFVIDTVNSELKSTMRKLDSYGGVNEMTIEIAKLFKTVEAVQAHMELTRGILQCESEEQVADMKVKYESVSSEYGHIKTKDDITQVPAKAGITIIYQKMFVEMKKILRQCFTKGYHGETQVLQSYENTARLQIIGGKFEAARQHFSLMISLPKNDIFCLEKSSQVWQDLYSSVIYKQINTKEQIAETSKKIHFLIRMSSVVVKRCVEKKYNPSLGLLLALAKDLMYYGVSQAEAETEMHLHLLNLQAEDAFVVWNLPEQPGISYFLSLRHIPLGYDQQLFIPRLFPKITKEVILQEYKDGTINKIHPMDPALLTGPDLVSRKDEVLKDLFKGGEDRVSVRLLAVEPLNINNDGLISFGGLKHRVKKAIHRNSVNDDTAIVIHLHGGGFVSLSSLQHKVYLARMVKESNLIHFSVDYRLAPKNQYPDPVDDVWQAYLWILNYSETILGIKTPKIVIAGDSAGGNLALALSLRLIRAGLQPPHALLLIYPCLAVDAKTYSTSYFLSIEDIILPYALLKHAAKAYTGDDFKNTEDPFISPIAASDELLEKLPPITVIAAEQDPLGDDGWRFLAKMRQLKKNVKMIVHEHLSHGYLFHEELTNYNVFIEEISDEVKNLIAIA